MKGYDRQKLVRSIFACALGAATGAYALLGAMKIHLMGYLPLTRLLRITLLPHFDDLLISASIIFLIMIAFGLPVQYLMQKKQLTGFVWHIALTIALVTSLLAILLIPANGFINPLSLVEVYIGGLVAITTFWLIRRPDRDCPAAKAKEITP